jgi:AbrB family looped-hinge helix DNA binding protein
MPLTKVGPKHQITIPKEVFEALKLEVGDLVELAVENGRGVMIPKQAVEKAPAVKLTSREQQLLKSAKAKIEAINRDIKTSRGLTEAEAKIAAKVGLIDPDQRWWWTEEWQKGEREAQRDIETGRVSKVYENITDALADLKNQV